MSAPKNFAQCTRDNLDEFVSEIDRLGGPDAPETAVVWKDFQYHTSISVDQTLDPYSRQYWQQQVELYEEISGRKLNQFQNELTDFQLEEHVRSPNSYAVTDPARMAVHYYRLAKLIKRAGLRPNARVLDMGCGWGLSSEIFATMGCTVTAVDISRKFVELVKLRSNRLNLPIEVIQSNFDDLKSDKKYDLIVFYESLHHALKPWELLEKASSWLAPDGKIALAGEPVQSVWWRNWGLRLDPLSIYCIRKCGWFESGWSKDFIVEALHRCDLIVDYADDVDPDIGPILIASSRNMRINDRQFVADLYRTLLSREPDEEGLSAHVEALRNGKSTGELMVEFVNSPEYRSRLTQTLVRDALSALTVAPPMPVELHLTTNQEQILWKHVAQSWTTLGNSEPYWSVLVDSRWKKEHMTHAEIMDGFYESGRSDVKRLDHWLTRNNVSLPQTATCAEFGCGVGRCTVWLARRFSRVIAFDISEPHLQLARVRAEQEGLRNIEFVHLKGVDDLRKIAGIDIFYSIIVLQHNPPPIILSILESAFKGINPGGVAFFQVPTYSLGYSFNLNDYLTQATDQGMEMHFVPQHDVFTLGSANSMEPLEISADGAIGHFGQWTSTSFLMRKQVCS